MSKFQAIVIAIFIICIIGGVIAFATYKGGSSANALPAVTIWGTFPENIFNDYVTKVNISREEPLKVVYTEISEGNFDKTFIEALARGQGPDAILVEQDLLYKHEDKIIPIPYSALSQRDFKDSYIQQAELYLHPTLGVLALPFVVDPLVMYWNRDIFTNAGIAVFPKFWDEFPAMGQKINQKDVNSNIRRSILALGEFSNIVHAREILGSLLLQAGNPITYRRTAPGEDFSLASALGNSSYQNSNSSLSAVNFFTKFSDPRDPDYSWNRSMSNSKNSFLSGALATYIGFASEIGDLRAKGPNLDFDIAPLPQARGVKNTIANRAAYGLMHGFSIVRSSADAGGTYSVLTALLAPESLEEMVKISYLPPVRRDMIAAGSTDQYLSIFYDSALISKGWLDSSISESNRIFREMTEAISSGRKTVIESIEDGGDEYNLILQNI